MKYLDATVFVTDIIALAAGIYTDLYRAIDFSLSLTLPSATNKMSP